MRKVILRNFQSPGDIVMLTASVRDLHLSAPGQFQTDVRTSCDDLWIQNPYLTSLSEDDPDVQILECHYPLVHNSDRFPLHFIHGFLAYLNSALGVNACVYEFKGDIHLSHEERRAPSPMVELVGEDIPFWIVCAGGKHDFTIKWWDTARYQRVVDHFKERIQFVQVGESGHHHPALAGAIDLRGKTTLRELIRLVYHAQGVLCGTSLPMHLAAAVPLRRDRARERACVVVAGGREPPHWEQYPCHQFIHTVGQLACCARSGCWRSRTVPLGDGEEHDEAGSLCLDVIDGLPRCMHMITPDMVIERIAGYFRGGALEYLGKTHSAQATACAGAMHAQAPPLTEETALQRSEAFIATTPRYPGGFSGRGITICGGGLKYFTGAWVCINRLRTLGCELPVQIWYLGAEEMTEDMKRLVAPLGVECVDGREVCKEHPVRTLNGWELKPYAILHSPFKEVLALDADNVPVRNPEFLFDCRPYLDSGAVFWPDYGRLEPDRDIWRLCGVPYADEPEHETGQILIDKEKCWEALCLAMFYNEHSDFYYHYVLGDKDTFHMAFRKLGKPYAMPAYPIHDLQGKVMCQHDFNGERLFQHRNFDKWLLAGGNDRIADFWHEQECLHALDVLREHWQGRFPGQNRYDPQETHTGEVQAAVAGLVQRRFLYRRVGHDERPMTFRPHGMVGEGSAACEVFWNIKPRDGAVVLEISSDCELTCRLTPQGDGCWRGQWVVHEQMPIELAPLPRMEP